MAVKSRLAYTTGVVYTLLHRHTLPTGAGGNVFYSTGNLTLTITLTVSLTLTKVLELAQAIITGAGGPVE